MPPPGDRAAGSGGSGTAFLVLLLAFVLVRSYAITRLPIFIDESIHLFWSARVPEPNFLRPFRDGKPLLPLALALPTALAAEPLRAARLTSVAAGALGLWAAWRIGRRLFGESAGLAAAALYLACPFALFYDRMALADVYLSTLAGLTLLASLALVADPRPRTSLWLGLALGGCVWAKVSGLVLAPLPLLAALLLRGPRSPWLALGRAYAVAAALAALPAWYFLAHSGQVQKGGSDEEVEPLRLAAENAGTAVSWLSSYWTIPFVAAAAGALAVALWRRRRAELLLAAAAVLPVGAFAMGSFHWYPRYVLFATIPFLVLAARGLAQPAEALGARGAAGPRARAAALAAVVAIASLPGLALDRAILRDPATAPLPAVERFQYVNGFSSGYGVDEAERHIRAALDAHPAGLTVAADAGGRRTAFLALRALFLNDARVEVISVRLEADSTRALLEERAARQPTFLVTNVKEPSAARVRAAGIPVDDPVPLRKPDGTPAGELFRVVAGAEVRS